MANAQHIRPVTSPGEEVNIEIDDTQSQRHLGEPEEGHQSPILVLSRDQALLETVRKAAPRGVSVTAAPDLDQVADKLPLLKPGVLVVHEGGKHHRLVVMGGFAEVNAEGLTILADFADKVEDFDRAVIASQIRETEQQIKETQEGSLLDRLIMRLDHYKQLDTHLQTTALH